MALIETPGESVSRIQLQQRLWPGAEFGDFDQGLNAAVNKLRQALADSADNPRYIETIAGEGYRFLAPVNRQSTRRRRDFRAAIRGNRRARPHRETRAESF
jgi:DNA-binding winged helix-turn-helix (wHTH) protein